MVRIRAKLTALMCAAATPGLYGFGCSGEVGREARDAALAGFASFVEAQTFDVLDSFFPDQLAEE